MELDSAFNDIMEDEEKKGLDSVTSPIKVEEKKEINDEKAKAQQEVDEIFENTEPTPKKIGTHIYLEEDVARTLDKVSKDRRKSDLVNQILKIEFLERGLM